MPPAGGCPTRGRWPGAIESWTSGEVSNFKNKTVKKKQRQNNGSDQTYIKQQTRRRGYRGDIRTASRMANTKKQRLRNAAGRRTGKAQTAYLPSVVDRNEETNQHADQYDRGDGTIGNRRQGDDRHRELQRPGGRCPERKKEKGSSGGVARLRAPTSLVFVPAKATQKNSSIKTRRLKRGISCAPQGVVDTKTDPDKHDGPSQTAAAPKKTRCGG
jgi:hypothetical protein